MTAVLILILSLYCLLMLLFLAGWVLIRYQAMPPKNESMPTISVVIAARNEEENIPRLIQDLAGLQYPGGKFEVIIVNDHSTDDTVGKASALMNALPFGKLINLPDGLQGKKEAMQLGVREAQYDIILTTDADCMFSKHWLQCVCLYFRDEATKMLIGPVKLLEEKSLFARIQATEFISLMGTTASTIGLKHPIMCNGANLAFRKSTFVELEGYEGNLQIASGDDEFLLRKVYAKYPAGIRFLNFYEAIVTTYSQKTLGEFFQQRIRWAGKWKHNTDWLAWSMAVFILLAQISFASLIVQAIYAPGVGLGLVVAKIFLEWIFLFWAGRFMERRFDILAFLSLQIIYPVYVTFVGIISLIAPYQWKKRNYK